MSIVPRRFPRSLTSPQGERSKSGGDWRALALVPLLGIVWGLNWPAVKIALGEIAPWTLRSTGMALGGLILAAAAAIRGQSLAVPRRHWPRLALGGILTIAAFNVLLAFAQLSAATSRAAIVTYTMPVWATLFARPILGERFDRRRLLGLALGIAGLAVLGLPLWRAGRFQIGLLYALLGGMSWAAGTVVTKRLPVAAPPFTVATWQLLIGAGAAAIGMLAFEGVPWPKPLAGATWVALAYHVLLAQALAYVLWFAVLERIPAGIASLGKLMAPAVGVIGAMIFIGERPSGADYLGLLLILAAAASVLVPGRR